MFVGRHSWPRVFLFAAPPHRWLGRVAVCVIRALDHAGWAAHVIHLCLGTRTQRALFFFCGCGLAGTPLHVTLLGLGRIECSVVVPRLRRGIHVDGILVVCASPPSV